MPSQIPFYHLQARQHCSGKDQLLFLLERANFAPLQSRNYHTNQSQILNVTSVRWKLIDWLTALWHISTERLLVPRNVAK